jgi:O-antigen chain-terminating methyltransferase
MRWYVEPLAVEQRTFNDAALKLIDGVSERGDTLAARVADAERELERRGLDARTLTELEERLTRLERRERAGTVAAQPQAAAMPDYFAFESRMRASTEEIRERQRVYVSLFRDAAPVLDVGCGRGEFLSLLREAGVEARGVDADGDMASYARGEGLDVEQADALVYLEAVDDASLGGVFAAQLVEHLPPPALLRLLELAARKLRPGGLLVAETINPLSPLALRHYFADLTHAQPLVPETLELLAKQAGFRETELRYANPPAEKLREVELPPDEHFDAARDALGHNVRRLNETLYGPLDYALVARV